MSLASLKKIIWARLGKLSEKTQKYLLHKEAAALLTEMQTSYYRLKRRYLEQECQIPTHYGFGMSNGRWAELAANSVEWDRRIAIEYIEKLAASYDAGPTGQKWVEAQANFANVSVWIASGAYKETTTDIELQSMIATIHTGIPRIHYKCPHGGE